MSKQRPSLVGLDDLPLFSSTPVRVGPLAELPRYDAGKDRVRDWVQPEWGELVEAAKGSRVEPSYFCRADEHALAYDLGRYDVPTLRYAMAGLVDDFGPEDPTVKVYAAELARRGATP